MPLKLTWWKRLPEEQEGSARNRGEALWGRCGFDSRGSVAIWLQIARSLV